MEKVYLTIKEKFGLACNIILLKNVRLKFFFFFLNEDLEKWSSSKAYYYNYSSCDYILIY